MEQTDTSTARIFGILLFLAAAAAAAWFFSDIVLYLFLAIILTMVGYPMVKLLRRVKIKGHGLPDVLIALLSLVFIFSLIFLFAYFIVPLIVGEIRGLLSIDPDVVNDGAAAWLTKGEDYLKSQGLLDRSDDLGKIIMDRLQGLFSQFSITTLFGGTVNFVASLCIGIFSVIFITFFCLKDEYNLKSKLRRIVPISFRTSFDHIITKTGPKLVRYFSGVLIEMCVIGIIEGLACYFLGVPNPLLIGFLGGLLNVIPYLGPIIAAILGSVIAIAGSLSGPVETMQVLMLVVKVFAVFLCSNLLIDNFILQPLIYSKSVKAHPLEIFFAIMVGATLGGALGMIFAVPVYSILKIVLSELFAPYYVESEPSAVTEQAVASQPAEPQPVPDQAEAVSADAQPKDIDNTDNSKDNVQGI
ncbi:MAG: AI-2E family transporter [Bacteroidales bacterium]|nr:AI-2E family transporter [Bacteroidales bacterium]